MVKQQKKDNLAKRPVRRQSRAPVTGNYRACWHCAKVVYRLAMMVFPHDPAGEAFFPTDI